MRDNLVFPAREAAGLYQYRTEARFSFGVRQPARLWSAAFPCLLGLGSLYQALASFRDRRLFPPPGRLVEVEGCPMHLRVAGRGQPTVLLETGLGSMSSAWAWVQPEAARACRVVSYDRAGLGWSGPASGERSAAATARRLRDLLRRSDIQPPFVVVGHSLGGLLVRVFTDLYPDEVTGVVLVDAVHPDQHLRSGAIARHMQTGFRFLKAVPLLARLGYVRLAGLFDAWSEGLPRRQAAESDAFLTDYRHLETTREDSLAWETLCEEVRRTEPLGDRPLAVVTAGKDVLEGQPELQNELASLSSDSLHLVVPGADHVTLVTRQEYAGAVVQAIRHVVHRSRSRHTVR